MEGAEGERGGALPARGVSGPEGFSLSRARVRG